MANTHRQISIGPLVALLGAVLLLVSLFLDWWEGLAAFTAFEVLDLVLAGLALAAILALADALGARLPTGGGLRSSAALPLGLIALVIVVSQLLNDPPAVAGSEADPDLGIWLALAGALLIAAGSLLSVARISLELDMERRERAGPAGARGESGAASQSTPPPASEAPTRAEPERPGGPERPV